MAREARAERDWCYADRRMSITAPTLLLSGSRSVSAVRRATAAAAAAIPGARLRVLDGHAHIAHRRVPGLMASIIREFVAG